MAERVAFGYVAGAMTVALIYPPTCDPTAPYLAVPTLAAWLRQHGVKVLPIDANLEAWESLLQPEPLARLGALVERRLSELDAKGSLSHEDKLLYTTLWRARGDAVAAPPAILRALDLLRGRSRDRFYDAAAYASAVATVDAAQRVVSAA
jgi:hypothetical protein